MAGYTTSGPNISQAKDTTPGLADHLLELLREVHTISWATYRKGMMYSNTHLKRFDQLLTRCWKCFFNWNSKSSQQPKQQLEHVNNFKDSCILCRDKIVRDSKQESHDEGKMAAIICSLEAIIQICSDWEPRVRECVTVWKHDEMDGKQIWGPLKEEFDAEGEKLHSGTILTAWELIKGKMADRIALNLTLETYIKLNLSKNKKS
ncbi:uncharacterized protein LOC135492522 [Lineus longissimus]|uniref:uncharacterized protein LOC135492522 n=1 Tax=Lineus longissimus TaxID=88925 RepID=UPI002B4DFCC0